jgi:hypothetical protein
MSCISSLLRLKAKKVNTIFLSQNDMTDRFVTLPDATLEVAPDVTFTGSGRGMEACIKYESIQMFERSNQTDVNRGQPSTHFPSDLRDPFLFSSLYPPRFQWVFLMWLSLVSSYLVSCPRIWLPLPLHTPIHFTSRTSILIQCCYTRPIGNRVLPFRSFLHVGYANNSGWLA